MSGAPDGVTIRPAAPDDAEQLAHLHVLIWEQAYTGLMPAEVFERRRATLPQRVEWWGRMLLAATPPVVVARQGDDLIGFAGVGAPEDEDPPLPDELWFLYVDSAWWGSGVGYDLFRAALGDRPAYLWVLQGNDRAIRFYRRQGFVADGVTREDDLGVELRMTRGAD